MYLGTSFEAPPISNRNTKKLGQNRGSIEERRSKIMDKFDTSNKTTRNFSSIMNSINIGMNNSVILKQTAHKDSINNSIAAGTNIKLVPLNKINKDMKKRLNNLRNKDFVGKTKVEIFPKDSQFRRQKIGIKDSVRRSQKKLEKQFLNQTLKQSMTNPLDSIEQVDNSVEERNYENSSLGEGKKVSFIRCMGDVL